ncbi:MAG: hypothetical protein EB072_06330, partial [Betaproteobacteria bacterium]|nr:hypothetical protein [Betaproteobacteria bacterium]
SPATSAAPDRLLADSAMVGIGGLLAIWAIAFCEAELILDVVLMVFSQRIQGKARPNYFNRAKTTLG